MCISRVVRYHKIFFKVKTGKTKRYDEQNSFYAFMAAALVTASCTTNEVPNDAISQSVTIVADVSSQSRAPELGEDRSGTFTKGDVMTLCVENNPSLDYAYQEDGLTWGMLNPAGITGQIKLSA